MKLSNIQDVFKIKQEYERHVNALAQAKAGNFDVDTRSLVCIKLEPGHKEAVQAIILLTLETQIKRIVEQLHALGVTVE